MSKCRMLKKTTSEKLKFGSNKTKNRIYYEWIGKTIYEKLRYKKLKRKQLKSKWNFRKWTKNKRESEFCSNNVFSLYFKFREKKLDTAKPVAVPPLNLDGSIQSTDRCTLPIAWAKFTRIPTRAFGKIPENMNSADHVTQGLTPSHIPKLWLQPPDLLSTRQDSWYFPRTVIPTYALHKRHKFRRRSLKLKNFQHGVDYSTPLEWCSSQ